MVGGGPLPEDIVGLEDGYAVPRIAWGDTEAEREAQLEEMVASNRPAIVTNMADDWPCWRAWFHRSPFPPGQRGGEKNGESETDEDEQIPIDDVRNCDPLLDIIGESTPFPARVRFSALGYPGAGAVSGETPVPGEEERSDAQNDGQGDEWLGKAETMTFGDVYERWQRDRDHWYDIDADMSGAKAYWYIASLPISRYFPMLTEHVDPVPPAAHQQKKSGGFWVGSRGQITPLHMDMSTGDPGMDGLHTVVFGCKRFRLFDPALPAHLEHIPRRNFWGRFHQSRGFDETGLPASADFRTNARCMVIDVRPGETIFIPKLWWHHVETLEPSIAVNFWFQLLASEKLKLSTLWPVIEKQLELTAEMFITREKMRNVLKFFGISELSDAEIDDFRCSRAGRLKFMRIERFVLSFGAGCRAPWVRNLEGAKELDDELCARVRRWVEAEVDKLNV
jgi:Cupin-like domain